MENTGLIKPVSEELSKKLEKIAYILKIVAHPTRLSIVYVLEKYPELTVNQICDHVKVEQSLVSHHLQNMRLKGILSVRKEGRRKYYSLKEREVSLVIECLEDCQCNM